MLIKYLICIIYSKNWNFFVWSISRETYALDDIWYVGRARAGPRCAIVHTEFWARHMLRPLGSKKMMVTFMEVKCQQRSNAINYVLWLPYSVKRTADASYE